MQRLDGRLVLSPTDLTHHQECAHLTRLDLGVALGEWAAPDVETSEELQFVFDRGMAHEEKYLASLEAAGKSIARIETVFDAEGRQTLEYAGKRYELRLDAHNKVHLHGEDGRELEKLPRPKAPTDADKEAAAVKAYVASKGGVSDYSGVTYEAIEELKSEERKTSAAAEMLKRLGASGKTLIVDVAHDEPFWYGVEEAAEIARAVDALRHPLEPAPFRKRVVGRLLE